MSLTQPPIQRTYQHRVDVEDERFELIYNRNQYLEREYAKVMRQLQEEKEKVAAKNKDLQLLHELHAKCTSLQNRQLKLTERLNEYHCQMQQAKGETIGLRRKIIGIIGHIKGALSSAEIPGSAGKRPDSNYQRMYEENKLLKWKLNVVEGYLEGMFAEEGALVNNPR